MLPLNPVWGGAEYCNAEVSNFQVWKILSTYNVVSTDHEVTEFKAEVTEFKAWGILKCVCKQQTVYSLFNS